MRTDGTHLRWLALAGAALALAPLDPAQAWEGMPDSVVVTRQVPQPDWSRSAVIYEVNLRQYTPQGTLAAFREHLPRLKSLGVDILWFMPLTPIGELNRKGGMGSYYSVKDYRALDPGYGSLEEFRSLVAEIHGLGMKVIVDWVANHCAWDNPIVTEHPSWITRDEAGRPVPPVPDWSDVVDLDYSQPGLREYMTGSLCWWLRETDIDGFRCDVAGMVPFDFWNEARPQLDAVKPVFMLAEWEDPRLHEHAFQMSYSWALYNAMNAVAQGRKPVEELDTVIAGFDRFPPDAYLMHFTTNHDENSWNGTEFERLGAAAEAMSVLSYTVPGMPLIYSGQEAGLSHRLSFFEKDSIPWVDSHWATLFTRLNALKHERPELANGLAGGVFRRLPVPLPTVYAFERRKGDKALRAVFNLGPAPVAVPADSPALAGILLLASPSIRKGNEGTILPPWGWQILAD